MSAEQRPDDRVWSSEVLRREGVCDRALRKWVRRGRFPKPDGNLLGRNWWWRSTYDTCRTEVLAGRYAQQRRPGVTKKAA